MNITVGADYGDFLTKHLPDESFTASSGRSGYGAEKAKLYDQSAWWPRASDHNPYWQVQLDTYYFVAAILSQGLSLYSFLSHLCVG